MFGKIGPFLPNIGKNGRGRALLDGDGLGEVARLVDGFAAQARDVVREQLLRHRLCENATAPRFPMHRASNDAF